MKKMASFVFLLLFIAISSKSFGQEKIPHTILIYMNGSDLESSFGSESATNDLKEMMNINSNINVKIVVETGGTLKWKTPTINSNRNQRWEISKNKMTLINDEIGKKSMGSSETLSNFITWSIKNYPSEKYSIVLWNHGGGAVNGFGYDELHLNNTSLTLDELHNAFEVSYKVTNQKFEIIGFDACLMSTIENAYVLKDFGNYLVASEELEPDHGWYYTEIINSIENNPKIKGLKLGRIICNSFKSQSENNFTNENITLSLVDLKKIDNLVNDFENLLTKLTLDLNSSKTLNEIIKARSISEDYGNSSSENSNMTDLGDLVKNLHYKYPKESQAVLDSLDNAVKYNISSTSTKKSTGLSIYFPYKNKNTFLTNYKIYNKIPFSNSYKIFLKKYTNKILDDSIPISIIKSDSPKNNYLKVEINPSDINQVDEIYSVLGLYNNENKIIYLGMDNDIILDNKTGVITDNFNKKWYTLNGEFVSMYLTDYYNDYYEYSIPAKLNNKYVDLIVFFNSQNPNGKILGAWEGINELSGMYYKEISQIKNGDELVLLHYYNDILTYEEGYIESKMIIVDAPLNLSFEELSSGKYLYGFYITDLSQNSIFSNFINIDIEETNQTLTEKKEDKIKVYLNGNLINFDVDPIIENNRTLVPIRKIFESFNIKVKWVNTTKTVIG
ncbi:MAG: clostripain-related cysteine peptidase, partial [Clostridiales bacterium]